MKNPTTKNNKTEKIKTIITLSTDTRLFLMAGRSGTIAESLKIQVQWAPSPKIMNKRIKTYNGNKKMCIYLLISEANFLNNTPDHLTNIEGYNIVKAKTTESLNYSRIVPIVQKLA